MHVVREGQPGDASALESSACLSEGNVDERSMTFVLFAVEPMYDSLHVEPRYSKLVSRIRPR